MISNGQSSVLAAFEMLVEEVGSEVEFVNEQGALAFAESDYSKAQEALKRAAEVTGFVKKVVELRREWEKLAARAEDATTQARRREFKRLRKGARTPEDVFRLPILTALDELEGSAPLNQVLDRVGELMSGTLRDVDYGPLPADPDTPRWRKSAHWARNTMAREGLLKDDSPRGTWELSHSGRTVLAREQSPETAASVSQAGL